MVVRSLIEQIEFKARNTPKDIVLVDEVITKGVTCKDIDIISGRVYAYLKKMGIGKEDFVLINLARGVLPVIAMVGVLKAGAAFTLVEEGYPSERIEYIRKDCGCIAEINRDIWEEILKCEPLSGHEITDNHDAAFAVYTSGTTGSPKGVLHEYGNIGRCIESSCYKGKSFYSPGDIGILLAPMNFVASLMIIFSLLYDMGRIYYIASYYTIKNPILLNKVFIEKRINTLFLTPSYVRMLEKNMPPLVKKIIVGSEPANNLFIDNVDIFNVYSMSESGFVVVGFKIDKPYAVCPIGKPQFELECMLLDEDGNEVPDGKIGEFCFENSFVRGYINLPEENTRAFKNGIYHTGDLAKKLPDGNYVLLGRSTDMIKINGNRIEPAEIEAAVGAALGIERVVAKGFENENKSYICVYYTEDIKIDTERLRSKLLKKLPYYMIPTYYMRIDNIPLRPNGKIDRKALCEPKRQNFDTQYVQPSNDIEKSLCNAFERVLGIERVGIYDDFYELGGDSLGSIEVITECGLNGLEASMIFSGRTAANIAKLYTEEHGGEYESDDEKNIKSLTRKHRLTTEQLYMVDYQLYTPVSTMYNIFSMTKFEKNSVDPLRLANAVDRAIKNHPVLLTKFSFNDDGEIVQSYDKSLMPKICVEKIDESDFNAEKDTLVQPFKIINSRLFRCRIFETENAVYLFMDIHHTIFDGSSVKVLANDIKNAYNGKQLLTDYYYLALKKREEAVFTPFYEESRMYFEKNYDGDNWVCFPPTDYTSRENNVGQLQCKMEINTDKLHMLEKKYKISRNEFFIVVSAIAVSMYAGKRNVKLSWIYSGRESAKMMNTAGLLFRNLPVAFCFDKAGKIGDVFDAVRNQVQNGIEHSCYPYLEKDLQVVEGDIASVLYQRDIRDVANFFGKIKAEKVDIRQNKAASQNVLDIEILDDSSGLCLLLEYSASRYKESSVKRFKDLFIAVALALVCGADGDNFTLADLDVKM